MPLVDIFLYGRIPAKLDIDSDGVPHSVSVETKSGVKWADLSDEELDAIANKFAGEIHYALIEYKREYNMFSKQMLREMRNDNV